MPEMPGAYIRLGLDTPVPSSVPEVPADAHIDRRRVDAAVKHPI